MIGAGLGIGEAMKVSGTAGTIADVLISSVGQRPLLALAVIYGITMVLTNLITAKAAALLLFPIAMATARNLDAVDNIMPFAIAVMVAAAASFATPIGYQTNLMVYGPGGYRYSDFMRIGAPLSLLVWIITMIVTPMVWPFAG